ncbi:CheY-like chemotaxis protein [Bradyrhizobium sp. USDA 4341]
MVLPGAGRSVFLVEDDAIIRMLLVDMLSRSPGIG